MAGGGTSSSQKWLMISPLVTAMLPRKTSQLPPIQKTSAPLRESPIPLSTAPPAVMESNASQDPVTDPRLSPSRGSPNPPFEVESCTCQDPTTDPGSSPIPPTAVQPWSLTQKLTLTILMKVMRNNGRLSFLHCQ